MAIELGRGVRIHKKNKPAGTEIKGEGGAAPDTGAEISLQPIVQPVVRQLCSCSQWGFTGMQNSTCSPWRTSCWSRWDLKETFTTWEAHTGAGSLQDLWAYEEGSQHWSKFADRTCDSRGDPHQSHLCLKHCNPWEGLTLLKLVEVVQLGFFYYYPTWFD